MFPAPINPAILMQLQGKHRPEILFHTIPLAKPNIKTETVKPSKFSQVHAEYRNIR